MTEQTAGLAFAGSTKAFAGEFALNLARPRPIGWHGALAGKLVGDFRSIALRPVGIAVRAGDSVIGISAGGAFVTGKEFALSGGAFAEQPFGPIHIGLGGEWQHRFSSSDELFWANVSLRFGGDRQYWPHARAGIGPVLVGGIGFAGDSKIYSLTLGVHVYAVD